MTLTSKSVKVELLKNWKKKMDDRHKETNNLTMGKIKIAHFGRKCEQRLLVWRNNGQLLVNLFL